MEGRLYEAAVEGNVISLQELLQENRLILDRVIVNCLTDTPLHVAAMLGHVDFVKEILRRKPELAAEFDSQRFSPLHLATAKGYVDIVEELLLVNPEMCYARDREGRNPLHIAVMKGRVDVLKELVGARPQAAQIRVDRGETILHLCVIHNQLEALKLLVETMGDHEFVNSKDNDGFTILHLAVADKQSEIVNYLIIGTTIDVNAFNANGITALDILAQSRRDVKDIDIGQSLRRVGAVRANDISLSVHEVGNTRAMGLSSDANNQITVSRSKEKSQEKYIDRHENWLEKKRSALMVAASLIATMAFQAGINPPGGVWQDNLTMHAQDKTYLVDGPDGSHMAGSSIMADNFPGLYGGFQVYNSIGFMASFSIILLLISGLPFKRRIFMWILMVIMWVAIASMAMTYIITIHISPTSHAIRLVIFVWICSTGSLLLGHTIRLTLKIKRNSRRLKRTRDLPV